MEFQPLDFEDRLEIILDQDISIASPDWLVIGRQVRTEFNKEIDLLAVDRSGALIVLELKRDKTPRDIIAQVLDYGSWVRTLRNDKIINIFNDYIKKYHPENQSNSIDDAFFKKFNMQIPDELNESHELVIVASNLDPSTERIVNYLFEQYRVNINALFFRVFKDDNREYLTRAWLKEPSLIEVDLPDDAITAEWNNEFYVSFGGNSDRDWLEAVQYGFISGGGGPFYSRTLSLLSVGDRCWVNIPGTGYVGVGRVIQESVPIDEFKVIEGGNEKYLIELPCKASKLTKFSEDPEKAEYLVKIEWIKTVVSSHAIKEKGFFGNQNTVARPTSPKWQHTINRLKHRFGID